MAVRLISASWAKKGLIRTCLDMMYVELMKNFLLADSSELMTFRLISCLLSPETFDSSFLDMMNVEFMKQFSSGRFERPDDC